MILAVSFYSYKANTETVFTKLGVCMISSDTINSYIQLKVLTVKLMITSECKYDLTGYWSYELRVM